MRPRQRPGIAPRQRRRASSLIRWPHTTPAPTARALLPPRPPSPHQPSPRLHPPPTPQPSPFQQHQHQHEDRHQCWRRGGPPKRAARRPRRRARARGAGPDTWPRPRRRTPRSTLTTRSSRQRQLPRRCHSPRPPLALPLLPSLLLQQPLVRCRFRFPGARPQRSPPPTQRRRAPRRGLGTPPPRGGGRTRARRASEAERQAQRVRT